MSIDRGAERSPAQQIADMIRADIEAGQLPSGTRVPPESSIMQQYGVARATARNAVAILRRAGLVRTVSGRGSYVTATADRQVVTVPPGATITARNASEHERRAGQEAPRLVVTTEAGRAEYPADEVEIHTTR